MFVHQDRRQERIDQKRNKSLQNYRDAKTKAIEDANELERNGKRWLESAEDRQEQAARWDHQDKIVQRSYKNLDTTEVRMLHNLPRNKIWLMKKIEREYNEEVSKIRAQGRTGLVVQDDERAWMRKKTPYPTMYPPKDPPVKTYVKHVIPKYSSSIQHFLQENMQVHRIAPTKAFYVPPAESQPPIVYSLDYNSSDKMHSYEDEFFRKHPQLLSQMAFKKKETAVFMNFHDSYRFDQSFKKPKKRTTEDEGATRWILLRKQYMDRLTELCGVYVQKYLESEKDEDSDTKRGDHDELKHVASTVQVREIETAKLEEEQKTHRNRHHFYKLIKALRVASAHIVQSYLDLGWDNCGETEEYIRLMASDLNWLQHEPMRSWISNTIIPINNPFLISSSIDGGSYTIIGRAEDLPKEMEVAIEEKKEYHRLGLVIWKLFNEFKLKPSTLEGRRIQNALLGQQNGTGDVVSKLAQSMGIQELFGHSNVNRGSKFYFDQWYRVIQCDIKIRKMTAKINKRLRREVFCMWEEVTWQIIHYRRLQRELLIRNAQKTLNAWRAYIVWCRKFNRKLHISNLRILKYNMYKLRAICVTDYRTRNNKFRRGLVRKREAFQHLIYNIVLERHALKFRLKSWAHHITGKPSLKTFATITLLPHLFSSWKCGYTKLSKMIKSWDRIVYFKIMKNVFDVWLERGGISGAYKWAKRKVRVMLQTLLMSKRDRIARNYIIAISSTKNKKSKKRVASCG